MADDYDAGLKAGAERERERIRLAALGCQDCGKVHEYRQASQFFWSWAADDGHSYAPAHVGRTGGLASFLADLTAPETPAAAGAPAPQRPGSGGDKTAPTRGHDDAR